MKDKKVLITGGAGFIGANLAGKLFGLGAEVTVSDLISRVGTTKIDDIKDSLTVIEFDILNDNDYEKLDTDFDYIFHLAGIASLTAFEKNPELGFKINADGTRKMLEFATKNNIKKFIFPSSGVVYGKYPKYVPIDENHPIDVSHDKYGMSKKLAEDLCADFLKNNGLPTLVFRLFAAFGPKQSRDFFIPTVILQAIEKGKIEIWNDKPTRDFTYIENLIMEGFIKGAESNYSGGPLNVGGGVERSVGDVARFIAKKFGVEVVSQNKEVLGPMRLRSENSLAKEKIGWDPKITFEEGLEKTIEWFKLNHHLY